MQLACVQRLVPPVPGEPAIAASLRIRRDFCGLEGMRTDSFCHTQRGCKAGRFAYSRLGGNRYRRPE